MADSDQQIVTGTTVTRTCLSTDHYLVCCRLQLAADRPSVTSFFYRDIKKINMDAFRAELTQSKLLQCSDDLDANTYAELINHELRLLMDRHAPVKHKVKRCGKNNCRWLLLEARAAKQRRRRLERRYRRTRTASDKRAYDAAVSAAHDSIMKSPAECFREQLAEAQGDHRATWRVANCLLHSKPSTYYSDDDCARLSSMFSRFFVDKLKRIGDTVPANLTSSSATAGLVRLHSGPLVDDFRPVTTAEVQRLLVKMPSKSSPLDIVPTSLLKSCSDIFAVTIARVANLAFRDRLFPACLKTVEVLPLLKNTSAERADPVNYRPI